MTTQHFHQTVSPTFKLVTEESSCSSTSCFYDLQSTKDIALCIGKGLALFQDNASSDRVHIFADEMLEPEIVSSVLQ